MSKKAKKVNDHAHAKHYFDFKVSKIFLAQYIIVLFCQKQHRERRQRPKLTPTVMTASFSKESAVK